MRKVRLSKEQAHEILVEYQKLMEVKNAGGLDIPF